MTNETYKKAEEIQKKLENLNKLHYIACKPYKRYWITFKSFFVSTYERDEVWLCDEGLTEVIREYCNKRIQELREELNSL